ncbi:MAG: InlB B-repeat-containing protein [Coprobacillaceae bacterium]
MEKFMKRSVACVLTLCCLVLSFTTIFANNDTSMTSHDVEISKNDSDFDLLSYISTLEDDVSNTKIEITDDGEFNPSIAGEYTVIYNVLDLTTNETTTKQLLIQVVEQENTQKDSVETTQEAVTTDSPVTRANTANVDVTTEQELKDELANVSSISEDTKIITITNDLVITDTVSVPMNHNKNVIIKGSDSTNPIVLQMGDNTKGKFHFNISSNGTGTLTFDGLKLQGLVTDGAFTNGLIDKSLVYSNSTKSGGITGNLTDGEIVIMNSVYTRINNGAFGSTAKKVTIDNTSFISNYSGANANGEWGGFGGAAINYGNGNSTPTYITNTSFIDNYLSGSGYVGGAISLTGGNGIFSIKDSYFNGNEVAGGGDTLAGGGAIAINGNARSGGSNLVIDGSLFEKNRVITPNSGTGTAADGGAIYIFHSKGEVNISNTSFIENEAYDEGGAISFVSAINENNKITNSTFYKNIAKGLQTSDSYDGGGAIEVRYARTGLTFFYSQLYLENNTITGNGAEKGNYGSATPTATQRAGGLYSDGKYTKMKNNIIAGNYISAADGVKVYDSQYSNFHIGSTLSSFANYYVDLGGNVYDKAAKDIFGVDEPSTQVLGGKVAGSDLVSKAIPTVPIMPEGLADDKITATLTYDENGHTRDLGTNLSDIGAVEMKWVKYVANQTDSDWTLSALTTNNGVTYYSSANPNTIYLMYSYGSTPITTYTKPNEPTDWQFMNWNTSIDGNGTNYNASSSIDITMNTNTTLYGKWQKAPSLSVTYDANGGTGTPPIDSNLYGINNPVTVLGQGSVINDGYKFIGWNTDADGNGTTYQENDTFPITTNTVLYAKWEELYTVTYDSQGGTSVPDVSDLSAGDYLDKPADPTKENSIFKGWYLEQECINEWNFDTDTITGNQTLYAKWETVDTPEPPVITPGDKDPEPTPPTEKPTQNNTQTSDLTDTTSFVWLLSLSGFINGITLLKKRLVPKK